MPGADYFVGFVQQYVSPQLFKDAPKLKLIQLLSAGYDRAGHSGAIKPRCRCATTAAPTRSRSPSMRCC
jgi:glyoxylate reductase/D-3-phosphoglycerate dehydrogenase